jgi:hypothetical protein
MHDIELVSYCIGLTKQSTSQFPNLRPVYISIKRKYLYSIRCTKPFRNVPLSTGNNSDSNIHRLNLSVVDFLIGYTSITCLYWILYLLSY